MYGLGAENSYPKTILQTLVFQYLRLQGFLIVQSILLSLFFPYTLSHMGGGVLLTHSSMNLSAVSTEQELGSPKLMNLFLLKFAQIQ